MEKVIESYVSWLIDVVKVFKIIPYNCKWVAEDPLNKLVQIRLMFLCKRMDLKIIHCTTVEFLRALQIVMSFCLLERAYKY